MHKARGADNVPDSQARSSPDEVTEFVSSPRCTGDETACPCSTPPGSTHLEHEPDEDAEHQAEADVCMVVNDELLAEERVTFRPPTESHGSGRALPAGTRTLAQQPQRKLLRPGPVRPPAPLPSAEQLRAPPPSSDRPAPGLLSGTAPGHSPLPGAAAQARATGHAPFPRPPRPPAAKARAPTTPPSSDRPAPMPQASITDHAPCASLEQLTLAQYSRSCGFGQDTLGRPSLRRGNGRKPCTPASGGGGARQPDRK